MSLFLSLFLVAATGQADPPCTATTSAGWVAALERTRSGGRARPTRTSADGSTHAIESADLLCAGDLIRNPPNSAFIVRLRLGGRELILRPGQPPHRIAPPGWLAAAGDQLGRVLDALGSYAQTRRSLATTGVRGPEGECQVSPAARGLSDNYIVADVPIRIAWNCPDSGREVRATVASRGRVRVLRLSGNVLTLDVARDCPVDCTLVISAAPGVMARERLIAVPRDRLALEVAQALRSGPAASALEGARLVEGVRPWRLLGASLLWGSACRIPAAAVASSTLYGLQDPERFCETGSGRRRAGRQAG
jgi:hypothetical protein